MFRRLVALVLALGLFLAGCGEKPKPSGSTADVAGEITVFAATSLTNAFGQIGAGFENAFPGSKVTFNFGASSALAQQILEGAKADVFASADDATMAKVDSFVVRPPRTFVRNRLVIVTKPGNPTKITTLADLASADVVALCGIEVPCGKYAAQMLRAANVSIAESHVTRGQNVAATLTAVAEGDAEAGIVYVTDARAAKGDVDAVTIPNGQNVLADYSIASLRSSSRQRAARTFMGYVRSPFGQRVLVRDGFVEA